MKPIDAASVLDVSCPADGRPLVSIVLPCFNEAEVLAGSFAAVDAHLRGLGDRYRFEYLIVDDGSTDATGRVAADLATGRDDVRVLSHAGNRGLGEAFRTAFAASRGDWVVTLDVDLSYSPDHVGRMLDAARRQGAQLVLASAYMDGGQVTHVPWLRRTLSVWGNRFLKVFSRGRLSTLTCMVRAYEGPFVRALVLRGMGMEIMPELVYKTMVMRGRIVEIPGHLDWSRQRAAGLARVSSMRIARHTLSTIVSGFFFRPFALMMVPGFVLLLVSAYANFWVAWKFFGAFYWGADSLDEVVRMIYVEHGHTLFVGVLSLVLSVSLMGMGLVALQIKRYFEDLYHLGVSQRIERLGDRSGPRA